MISTYGDNEMWEITDVQPLWDECCKDMGIDPRLVKTYFFPRDEFPDWLDSSDYPMGAACCEESCCPEVLVLIYDCITGFRGLMKIRDTIYHELTHVILQKQAGEEEVTQFADIISRRRGDWQYCRSYLRREAFKRKLGPAQESWTLFQWASQHRPVGAKEKP